MLVDFELNTNKISPDLSDFMEMLTIILEKTIKIKLGDRMSWDVC